MVVKGGEETTDVTPLPNHEWESSCATTSTRVRSPVRRAGTNDR